MKYVNLKNPMKNLLNFLFPAKGKRDEKTKAFDIFKYDGMRAYRKGQARFAVKCFEKALDICDDQEVMLYLMMASTDLGEYEQSLDTANRILELYGEVPAVVHSRAFLLFTLGRTDEALADCNRLLSGEKPLPEHFDLSGIVKNGIGDYKGAIEDLSRGMAVDPKYSHLYIMRAEALSNEARYDEALADLRTYLELSPDDELGYYDTGVIYEKYGRLPEALEYFNKALERNPYHEDANMIKAVLILRIEGKEAAEAFVDEVEELIPNFRDKVAEKLRDMQAAAE
jgi:tetratricopeptide (TPR) repeat protein